MALLIKLVAVSAVMTLLGVAAGQSSSTPTANVIESFDAHSFSHPVHLPKDVLDALLREPETSYARDWASEHPNADARRFFLAERAHLGASEQPAWIVFGVAPLTGADQNWFWLVRSESTGPRVVLFSPGYIIHILQSETKGIRDVDGIYEGASQRSTSVYRYNGSKYALVKTYWESR